MPRKREPVTITDLGRYECAQCHVRFAWASTRPIDPLGQRDHRGGRRGGGRPPKFCSYECQLRARVRKAIHNRGCGLCQAAFSSRHKETAFCSKLCAAAFKSLERRQMLCLLPLDHWARWYGSTSKWHAPAQPPPKATFVSVVCKECEQPFLERRHDVGAQSLYCSSSCCNREHRTRRSARLRGANHVERGITWRALAKRNGLSCHICGEQCDPDNFKIRDGRKVPLGKYPSVDHLRPVARRGKHTWDNVALAHMRCNSRKGTKPLALVMHPGG